MATFKELPAGSFPNALENHWITKNGGRRLIAWNNTVLLGASNQIEHVIGTGIDITELRAAERATVDALERGRREIGQDLHDGLGQHLTGLMILGRVLQERLADREAPEAEEAGRISRLAQEAVFEAKRIARGLYPAELQGQGLAAALDNLTDTTSAASGIRCHFDHDGPSEEIEMEPTTALHLYRIAQEAVSNAARHGEPQAITVTLDQPSSSEIILEITDDGSGIEGVPRKGGMGIITMEHRARTMGGGDSR